MTAGDPPEPVVFAGRPGALRGRVPVRAGERPLAVARAEVTLDALPDRVRAVAVAAVVPAGTEQPVPVCISLDRTTPPGRYAGRLTMAGRTVPVVAEVDAAPRLSLAPGRIDAGAARTEVVAENRGNVAVDVPRQVAAGDVVLHVSGPERLDVGGRAVLVVVAGPGDAAEPATPPAAAPPGPMTRDETRVSFGGGTLWVKPATPRQTDADPEEET